MYVNTLTGKNTEKTESDVTKTEEVEAASAADVHLVNSVGSDKGFLVTS